MHAAGPVPPPHPPVYPKSVPVRLLAWRRVSNLLRPNVSVTKAPDNIQVDWNVPVRVRDGCVLRVNVFRPAATSGGADEKLPCIMCAHPYGKDALGLSFQYRVMPQSAPISFSEYTSWEAPDPAVWCPLGYAVVNVDLRGAGKSEGLGELLSSTEAEDYYDVIEWAAAQPWCSGRVGLDGVSYLCMSQYRVAALQPPHLCAMVAWEGVSDAYRDFVYPGGVREDGFTALWSAVTARVLRSKAPALRASAGMHPERDAWWQARSPALERIAVPMLICASFSDHSLHTRGSFEVFRRAGTACDDAQQQQQQPAAKWLYTHRQGKWSTYYGAEATATRRGFFDCFLKHGDGVHPWLATPKVRLAVHDAGPEPVAVVFENEFPPIDLEWRELFLSSAAAPFTAAFFRDAAESATLLNTLGPGVAFAHVFEADVDVIGAMALRLHVELMDGSGDPSLFVGVRKVRNGVEMCFEGSYGFSADMVSKGWQRLSHRDLDPGLAAAPWLPVHTHAESRLLRVGEPVAVDVELRQHATRFLKGDVLVVELRGQWHYPSSVAHLAPLRGQFPAAYVASPPATLLVRTGGTFDSRLLLGSRAVEATERKTAWSV